ncbi:Sulfoxide reductase heme-binding subunit YedZ [Candidatus Anstonella stagnisolia]|nr:Sulfoxide reductase heme-binding subunit YedZ [Candidatus Anstonella stagnisolia]
MDNKAKVYLGAAVLMLLVFGIGMLGPAKMQPVLWMSYTGFLALASLLLVVAIPIVAKATRHPLAMKALVLQRQLGICVFLFALVHVLITMQFGLGWNIAFLLDPQATFLLVGAIAFLILFAMAATSNDFSVKTLGKNWKRLQMLVYVAILLLLAHFINAGLVFAKNPIVVGVVLLFCVAGAYFRFKPKAKPPVSAKQEPMEPSKETIKQ